MSSQGDSITGAKGGHSYSDLTSFFIPLALMNISQSFTYPLVAMVATRGPEGAFNIAALAQATSVAFLLFNLTSGMITTGMVFMRSVEGYRRYVRLNYAFTISVMLIHLACCIPPVAHLIFGKLMGLPPKLESLTYTAFVLVLPLSMIFNWRNPHTVVLLNEKQTGRAYFATFARIVLTIVLSFVLSSAGLVGIYWAVFCLVIPILVELAVLVHYAKPYLARLPSSGAKLIGIREMAVFAFSFSAGSVLIAFCGYLIGAFAARAPVPETMLPVYYAALGLAGPFCFGAARIQALVIAFARERGRNAKLAVFTAVSGLIMGIFPLAFLIPYLDEWYYLVLQKLPPGHLVHIKTTALFLLLTPLSVAFRSFAEGWAAHHRSPASVIAGQIAYLGSVVGVAFLALHGGCAGNIIGPVALTIGNICAMGATLLVLNMSTKEEYAAAEPAEEYYVE